jgi:hypothetical protein
LNATEDGRCCFNGCDSDDPRDCPANTCMSKEVCLKPQADSGCWVPDGPKPTWCPAAACYAPDGPKPSWCPNQLGSIGPSSSEQASAALIALNATEQSLSCDSPFVVQPGDTCWGLCTRYRTCGSQGSWCCEGCEGSQAGGICTNLRTPAPVPVCFGFPYVDNNCGDGTYGCYPDQGCERRSMNGCAAGGSPEVCRYCAKPGGLNTAGHEECPTEPVKPSPSLGAAPAVEDGVEPR